MKSTQVLSAAMLFATCWAWPLSGLAVDSAQMDRSALDSSSTMNQAKDTQQHNNNKVMEVAEMQMMGDANMVQDNKRDMLEVVGSTDAQDFADREGMTHERQAQDGAQNQPRPEMWSSLNVFKGAEASKRDAAEMNGAKDKAIAQDALGTADSAMIQNGDENGLVDDIVMMTANAQSV